MTRAGQPRPVAELLDGTVFDVAARLIGCELITEFEGRRTSVVVSEVEAYAGPDDPASHAYRGPTPRNRSMFGPAGSLYVYRSYGIHWCMNIVVGDVGVPHAVLLRGGVPATGIETMEERRGRNDHLTDGPGKLCQALGVTGDHDGSSVLEGPVRLEPGTGTSRVRRTPRIGISVAKRRPWRYVADS